MKKAKRIHIKELHDRVGETVKIAGWVHTIRDQGAIKFIVLRDVTGKIQVVVEKESKLVKTTKGLTQESVIEITGMVKKEKQAKGGIEIEAKELEVLSQAEPMLPIPVAIKGSTETKQSKRLDWRWIDLRKPEKRLIFKVWTTMEQAFREYCISQEYIEIHTPKLMKTPSESGSELFEVKYFDRKAYLAQSPQFYKQMALAAGFEKVFEVGPYFRANPSFTPRHDTEFTGWDFEIAYIDSHDDVMKEEEKILSTVLSAVKEKHGEEIKEAYGQEIVVPEIPFPRVTMAEAKELLAKHRIDTAREGDLSPEEERKLCDVIKEKYGHELVFVTDWPASTRPFYHMRYEDNPKLTKSFDLLWKGIEITTGAQREHRYNVLKKQAETAGVGSIDYYLNFFKYGCPPHGGCAPGPSRMLTRIFGIDNVREVTLLYRGVKRLSP